LSRTGTRVAGDVSADEHRVVAGADADFLVEQPVVRVLPDPRALGALPGARVPEQRRVVAPAALVVLESRSTWTGPARVADFILDERKRAVAAIDILGGVGRARDAGFCLAVSVPIMSPLAHRCAVVTDAGFVLSVDVLSSWARGTGVGR